MKIYNFLKIISLFLLVAPTASYSAVCLNSINKCSDFASKEEIKSQNSNLTETISLPLTDAPPKITATGSQYFCPGNSIKIVTDIAITDPDDTGINSIYIQISSGYVNGEDQLTLTGFHPGITSEWYSGTGKLKI